MTKRRTLIPLPGRTVVALGVLALAGVVAVVALAAASPRGTAAEPAGKIYWTDPGAGKIQRANLDGSEIEDVITELESPGDIAIDPSGGKMYWTDRDGGKIQRASLDGSGVEDLVTDLQQPWSIALDVAGGKMYWTDSSAEKIQRANLDGGAAENVMTLSAVPWGIAVDPGGGKVYWSESGKIKRANLDGTGAEVLVTELPSRSEWGAADIALDVGAGKMYFTVTGYVKRALHFPIHIPGVIGRADLDGTLVAEVVSPSNPMGIALDVREGRLYYANTTAEGCWGDPPVFCDTYGAFEVNGANLNGSDHNSLVTDIVHPASVALDVPPPPPPPTSTSTPTATPRPVGGLGGLGDPDGGGAAGIAAPDTGAGGTASVSLVWGLLAAALGLAGAALVRWGLGRRYRWRENDV